MQRLEGPRCLFLEDTCGNALEVMNLRGHGNVEVGMLEWADMIPFVATIYRVTVYRI